MIDTVEKGLDFCKEIYDFETKQGKLAIDNFLSQAFFNDFILIYEKEKSKLPYHINLLDEIHANENAHSRILTRLLQAKDSDYYILKSFLQYIGKPFSELSLNNNDNILITAEKDRIDLRIRTNNFSIIIENKIYDAVDQYQQIQRYVDIEKNAGLGYSDEKNIFVIYMSSYPGKMPPEESLPDGLLVKLNIKFKAVSYCNTILPWLEENVLPNCLNKEPFLTSAITQYIDHLNGMFNKRKFEIHMNEELKKHILDNLQLNNKSLDEQIEGLSTKEKEVAKILAYLRDLKNDKEIEKKIAWLKEINRKMEEDFPNFICKYDNIHQKWPKSFIVLNIHKWPEIKVTIEIDLNNFDVYYGILANSNHGKDPKILELINDGFFNNFKNETSNRGWYTSINSDYENIYPEFKIFVNKLLELMR